MSDLVQRAMRYATEAHGRIDQRRKYTRQPYDVHLRAVAELVGTVTDDEETLAAAWLHDVVEDTPATFQDVEREFGPGVRALVAEVTDVSRPGDGNRAARRAIDCEHLALASPRAQTIKLADLIDNCRDICSNDEGFGRVFVTEMAALLDVLGRGDGDLYARARDVLRTSARDLRVDPLAAHAPTLDEREAPPFLQGTGHRAWTLFARAFAALDVAEPLRSFDGERPVEEVKARMRELEVDVAGVRRDGEVSGYLSLDALDGGRCAEVARPFARDQTIDAAASLTEVVRVLTRYEHGFVVTLGGVGGVLTRGDVQKPLMRMWLFGMITLIELTLVERIRTRWPDDGWLRHLSEARRQKARELMQERRRLGRSGDLLDCLQLSDKAGVLLRDPDELAFFGFDSRKAAKRAVKELSSLRNNLAHAQDIVTHDWAQIARMTSRIEALGDG
jgi:hypothetical protein